MTWFLFGKKKLQSKVDKTNAEIEQVKTHAGKKTQIAIEESKRLNVMINEVKASNDLTLKLLITLKGGNHK